MPGHKYTILQICIICFLVSILGLKVIWRYPEWFNGEGHNNKPHSSATRAERLITLGSVTSSF